MNITITQSTLPDAHTAKSARRAGAPNHLVGSGETSMVGTRDTQVVVPDEGTLEIVRPRLAGQAYRFVTVTRGGRLAVDMVGLAGVVAEIVTDLTQDLETALNAVADESDDLHHELARLQAGYEKELNTAAGVIAQLECELRAVRGSSAQDAAGGVV
jgi:hypothetical protein